MTPDRVLARLLERAEANGWAGADPYDGLLSGLGRAATPFGPWLRFAISQSILRVPAARMLASPPRSVNPKALALFLGATARGHDLLGDTRARTLAARLLEEIERRGTRVGDAIGWGYPFPWQSRLFWAPAGTPNAVVTATVGWHLLEYADRFHDSRARALALGAARFLGRGLHASSAGERAVALSYTRADSTRVVNISALAARLLLRAARYEAAPEFTDLAGGLLRFVLQAQRSNGSWPYAAEPGGDWEDSFHTGYVLDSLLSAKECGYTVPHDALARGFEAYERFFGPDGSARLYARSGAPLDSHSAAQGILTYAALGGSPAVLESLREHAPERARRIADWALRTLWIERHGRFAYRIEGGRRDERDYMRWVGAWMALAMAAVASMEEAEAVISAARGGPAGHGTAAAHGAPAPQGSEVP